MSLNFKLFEIKAQNSQEIIFSAYVADEKAYRITVDITGRFKKKFLKILNGTYKHTYFDRVTEQSTEYEINGSNPLLNLQKYADDCSKFSHSVAILSASGITHQYTLHFYGIDYNMSKGMEPKAQHRANNFFFELHKISQMRIAANTTSYRPKPQEFATAEAASLKLEMYSTIEMLDFKIVFKQLLNDINNGVLSTAVSLGNRYEMYRKLFREFAELRKFDNLDLLKIIIDGQDTDLTDFEAISELTENIYGEAVSGEMIIQSVKDNYRDGTFDGLKVDTLDFSYETTWKYHQNKVLSKLLYFSKGERVKLTGWTDGERIRGLESIEFLRDNFIITSNDKNNLQREGFTIDGKKISIAWE